jgi:hypothetical protein
VPAKKGKPVAHRRKPARTPIAVFLEMDDETLKERGVSPRRVRTLVRKLEECGQTAADLGLTIFGRSGSGELLFTGEP